MKWIKLADRMPDEKIDGEKVLILRVLGSTQESQAVSIHPVDKIKHCNPEETWWVAIGDFPAEYFEILKTVK